ncbi:gas vesicle protein K [Okeania sp. SIO1I7]|uniref:gas vesicle protein K n=1 Tax=Okeania sp. SIO1I7 TaxID=2607772 RepID=UPI003454CA74
MASFTTFENLEFRIQNLEVIPDQLVSKSQKITPLLPHSPTPLLLMSPEEPSIIPIGKSKSKSEAGLAPLLLTVIELVRQLMEAQVIRRMDAEMLSDEELDRAAESLRQLEEQVIKLCEVFDIDPEDLNLDLGEIGTLLPKSGEYYPGENSESPSILELLDRIINTGVVLDGSLDLGLAELSLIHARLHLVLTSKPISQR